MAIKAIIFDLDDTLYPEAQYKESGFRYLSKFVSDSQFVYQLIREFDQEGPRPLTDLVDYLVQTYRSHPPDLSCYEDTLPVLTRLRGKYKLGLLTDNATGAQPQKIESLQIAGLFDAIVIADPPDLKPSSQPFLKILEILNVGASESIYVGDDIEKDFVTANELGLYTVQIVRPNRLKLTLDKADSYKAKQLIHSLFELENILENL